MGKKKSIQALSPECVLQNAPPTPAYASKLYKIVNVRLPFAEECPPPRRQRIHTLAHHKGWEGFVHLEPVTQAGPSRPGPKQYLLLMQRLNDLEPMFHKSGEYCKRQEVRGESRIQENIGRDSSDPESPGSWKQDLRKAFWGEGRKVWGGSVAPGYGRTH